MGRIIVMGEMGGWRAAAMSMDVQSNGEENGLLTKGEEEEEGVSNGDLISNGEDEGVTWVGVLLSDGVRASPSKGEERVFSAKGVDILL